MSCQIHSTLNRQLKMLQMDNKEQPLCVVLQILTLFIFYMSNKDFTTGLNLYK